jgi:uncharacterized membrane protein (DUF2068 family)
MSVLDAAGPAGEGAQPYLTAREVRWVLRRCARQGHVLARLADADLARLVGPLTLPAGDGTLLRCLRCGNWVDAAGPGVAEALGSVDAPVGLDALPLPVRGGHGRRFGLLKLVAVERFIKGIALIGGALVAYHVASNRRSILAEIERLLLAFQPLGNELGLHLVNSPLVIRMEGWLSGSGTRVQLAGLALLAYGVLQIVEGIGLWGGWRWAEYLAVVATSVFVPFEVYEIAKEATPLKVGALVINITIVVYLLYKGRLFGLRGGHEAFLAEVRDSTLPADLLRSVGRSSVELTGHRIV